MPSLSWSPDGKWLAFPGPGFSSKDYDFARPSRIHLLNIETLEDRILPDPWTTCTVALAPAYSRDGDEIASYCAEESFAFGAIYIQSVQGRTIRKFARIEGLFEGLTWSPDGKSIVYSLNNCLWRQVLVEGPPEKLPFGQDANAPTFARVGGLLAFVRSSSGFAGNLNIWRLDLSSPTRPNGIPVRVIASNRGQEEAQISPDGKRIAFVSERSGNPEIWVAESDGSNIVQLTSFGDPFTGTPRWDPDSRRIVFDSRVSGHAELYVVDASGGPPRRLQTETPDASTPYWSRDGRWIYFSVSVGKTGIWKVPAEGGVAIQLTTDKGANLPQEARDTKRILYLRDEPTYPHSCLGSVSVNGMDGRREYCVELKPPTFFGDEWTPGPKGIYFLTNKTNPVSLNLLNLSSGKIQHVADVPGRLPDWGSQRAFRRTAISWSSQPPILWKAT